MSLETDLILDLPYFLRQDPTIAGIQRVIGAELDDLQATLEIVRSDAFPTLTSNTALWEAVLGLYSNDTVTLATRRSNVLAALLQAVSEGTGKSWESAMGQIFGGPGWRYREYIPAALKLINLVTNPSFETGVTGWSNDIAGGTLSRVNANATKGDWIGRMVSTGGTFGARFSITGLTPGDWFSAQCDIVASDAVNPRLLVDFYGSGNTVLIQSNSGNVTSSGISKVEGLVIPAGADSVRLKPQGSGSGARTLDFDGVMAVKYPRLPRYFDGSQDGVWTGTAHASTSTQQSTNTDAAFNADLIIPFANNTPQATVAVLLAKAISPANLLLNFIYDSDFIIGTDRWGDTI